MKRTKLVLDEALLEEVTRVSGERTYSRAVTRAIEDYLHRYRAGRILELLQGFQDERAFRLAREAMLAFPIVQSPLRSEVLQEAAQLYRLARRAGVTVRSGVDCLIAACALRHDLSVFHDDRDLSLLAQVSPLQERRLSR
jgi:predicted nucleic acid-binding protein